MRLLTAHVMVRNEPFVYYTVKSIYDFCDVIFLYDTGSDDDTLSDIKLLLNEDKEKKIDFQQIKTETNELGWTKDTVKQIQAANRGKFGKGCVRKMMLKRTKTKYCIIVDGDEVYYPNAGPLIRKSLEDWPIAKVLGGVKITWMCNKTHEFVHPRMVGRVFVTALTEIGITDSPGEMAVHAQNGDVLHTLSKWAFAIPGNPEYLHWENVLKPWRRTPPENTKSLLPYPLPPIMLQRPEFYDRFQKGGPKWPPGLQPTS